VKKNAASAALLAAGLAIGAAGGAISSTGLKGTVYVHFTQSLPDGGVRDLGRTGCYDLDAVKATVEPCATKRGGSL
jgi:hypothetical protein